MRTYKKWLTYTLISTLIVGIGPFLFIAGFNFYVDPLWNFSHAHDHNNIQRAFDERQVKTNAITHNDFDVDTLIIGDSRVSYMNQNEVIDYNAYNYAVSSMRVSEFNDYIEYAKTQNGREFEHIIIGLNFIYTNENTGAPPNDPDVYFNQSNEMLYTIKSLFSKDTFEQAKINFDSSKQNKHLFGGYRHYDRNNVASNKDVSDEERDKHIAERVASFEDPGTYEYSTTFKSQLREVKQNNPNTTFIVYTTPVTAPYFEAEMAIEDRWIAYKKMIADTIDVFGSMYNFNYVNTITSNHDNFYDSQHSSPDVSTLIAHKIIGVPNPDIPDDFGVHVTQENRDQHLNFVGEQIEK